MRHFRNAFSALLNAAAIVVLTPLLAAAQIDVWVDPGHGGGDSGSSHPADGLSAHYEKNITLPQGLALVNSLTNLTFNALSTRNSDVPMSKARRWKISNGAATNDQSLQATCQVFISIHMNEDPSLDPSTRGTETYYSPAKLRLKARDAYRADSSFAAAVHPKLMANANVVFTSPQFCSNDRHIKTELHTVTKRSEVPAILIEVCFLTNMCQLNTIVQPSKQAVIADGIAAGVSDYITPLAANGPRRAVQTTQWDGVTYVPGAEGKGGSWPRSPTGTLAYSEGFEGPTFPPTGWTTTTLGAPVPYRWFRTTDPLFVGDGSGGAVVRGPSPGAVDEWLISPMLFVSSTEHTLQFLWSGNELFASAANATSAVRPAGSPTWTTVWSLLSEPPGNEWTFRTRGVSLTPWISDSVQIAFRVAGTSGADFMLDDVAVGNFPVTTAPANDLCANATPLPAGSFTTTGSTCYATNNIAPPAGGTCLADDFTGADVFYQLGGGAGDTLEVSVTGASYPVAYLVASCDSTASCLAATPSLEIADHLTGSFEYVFPSTGHFYLVVDGLDGECGNFILTTLYHGPTVSVLPHDGRISGVTLSSRPNPGRTEVSFYGSVPPGSAQTAHLAIHDPAGRVVAAFDVPSASGKFTLSWDTRDQNGTRVPPGVYFVKLTAGGQSTSRSVILTK